jgi:hypothetical protein
MERGLRSPAFAADSLGSNALFSLDRALICADIHPLKMHTFHGISAQPLFCQRLRSTSSAIAVYRPFVSSLAWPKTRNFESAPSVVVAERGPALQLTNKAQHHSLADLLGRLNAALRARRHFVFPARIVDSARQLPSFMGFARPGCGLAGA